jgi:predicted acyl esterase
LAACALAALAGCIGTSDDPLQAGSVNDRPTPETIEAPEEAEVQAIEEGARLVFENVELPLETEIEVPNGTELVRVNAQRQGSGPIYPVVTHAETDAYRCLPALRTAWNVGVQTNTTCAGLAAVDGTPTTWKVGVYGTPNYDYLASVAGTGVGGEAENAVAETVHVDLVSEAPGGVTEDVDLDRLSKSHHEIGDTSTHNVESHDGAELFVEVTTPADENHEAYPTLLISSPYTTDDRQAGERPYDDLVKDYVSRGYAVVVADVRGFGRSDGCLEVWGPNEQADQAELVDWITDQDFSDGSVGMYGVSYPGTTPVQAAVQAPEGLEAIVSTAGVINAYRDWHFGGVPNGESIGSPVFYQALGTETTTPDPVEQAMDRANAVCDATLVERANDPRAVYDGFFEARNFTERTDQVEAAVMVEHGYDDPNVKSSMQVDWFNALDVPKLGLFGHWDHQPGARADEVTLRMAWMDQFVKGQDVGLANVSKASISANGDRYREADAWPDPTTDTKRLHANFDEETFEDEPADSRGQLTLTGASALRSAAGGVTDTMIPLSTTLDEPLSLAGQSQLAVSASLEGAENAYLAASLYDVNEDGLAKLVTYGWVNLAHRDDHTSYEPLAPNERVDVQLPLLPTEYTFEPGDELRLELRGVTEGDWSKVRPGRAGELVLHGGEDGTALQMPTVSEDAWQTTPASVHTLPAK